MTSAGALIYAAAKRDNRYALSNTRFLLHQPLGGAGGRASDIEIEANQILQMRKRLNRMLARATGQDYEAPAGGRETRLGNVASGRPTSERDRCARAGP